MADGGALQNAGPPSTSAGTARSARPSCSRPTTGSSLGGTREWRPMMSMTSWSSSSPKSDQKFGHIMYSRTPSALEQTGSPVGRAAAIPASRDVGPCAGCWPRPAGDSVDSVTSGRPASRDAVRGASSVERQGAGGGPCGAVSQHEQGPALDLVVDAADVGAHHAQQGQLDSAEERDHDDHASPNRARWPSSAAWRSSPGRTGSTAPRRRSPPAVRPAAARSRSSAWRRWRSASCGAACRCSGRRVPRGAHVRDTQSAGIPAS